MKDTLKATHPLCHAIAYKDSRSFGYQTFKVKEDREFLLGLIDKNDKENLDFMESFYLSLKKDQACAKDIFIRGRRNSVSLSDIED